MRIVRFSPGPESGLGTDPLFGILEEDNQISVISGDPIYHGVTKTAAKVELTKVRLLAPVIPRSKIVAVGKNYADHAKEMGSEVPKEPIIFLKPNTSVIGPGDTIVWPAMAPTIDYEAELAVVIGRVCKDVPKERVHEVIYGYTLANDITCRELQKSDGQWARAKGFDTFGAFGPSIVTDVDLSGSAIRAELNGRERQNYPVSDLFMSPAEIVARLSESMTLEAGDLIACGTGPGALPMKPGATIDIIIDGIGTLSNTYEDQN